MIIGKITYRHFKGCYRQALIDEGMYQIPTHKVHKNKKKYTRKSKHKNNRYD